MLFWLNLSLHKLIYYLTNLAFNYIIITVGSISSKTPLSAEIKKRKIFVKRDIFVYVSIAVLVLGLFISLLVFNNKDADGFKVELNGQTVLTHVYGKEFKVEKDFLSKVTVSNDGEHFTVKITSADGYNILFVNESDKSVKMQESDCPSQNCVHMQEIKNAGAIFCAPRQLKITPLFDNEFVPPSVGGAG